MSAIILSADNILTLKRTLRPFYEEVGSAHLTEAIASALGFRTHAALIARIGTMDPKDPEIEVLDDEAFFHRLGSFGYDIQDDRRKMGAFDWLPTDLQDRGILVNTTAPSTFEIEYKSLRQKAWRNVLVSALNAGIEQRLFTVRPGDNRWPGWEPDREKRMRQHDRSGVTFSFVFGDGVPALAYVGDAGWDELRVNVILWPTDQGKNWVEVANTGFHAGDVIAGGWLERRDGAWLQHSTRGLRCRKHRLEAVASVSVRPKGFGDRGDLKM